VKSKLNQLYQVYHDINQYVNFYITGELAHILTPRSEGEYMIIETNCIFDFAY